MTYLVIACVSGCGPTEWQETPSQDPVPIFGCYTAPDAPSFKIDSAGVSIIGAKQRFRYRYELPKIGTVLRIPMDATIVDGRFVFEASKDRFYRVLHRDAGPVVRVVFGPSGVVKDYGLQPAANCGS